MAAGGSAQAGGAEALGLVDEPDSRARSGCARTGKLRRFQDVPHFPVGLLFRATDFRSTLKAWMTALACLQRKRV